MSDAPLTCPYCNAYVPAPAKGPVALDGRVVCPRCGELFTPPPGSYVGQPADGPTMEAILGDTPVSLKEKPRGRNRLVGLGLLALMAVMAGTALTYALVTTAVRRAHDTGSRQTSRPLPIPTGATVLPETGPVAPAKLDALAYLPPDTGLIVGVHLAEIGNAEAGKALLAQPVNVGPRDVTIDDLLRWTGFRREEVLHLVIGVKIDDPPPLPPRMNLVLHTKAAFDAGALRKRLKAERQPDVEGHQIYTFRVAGLPLPPAFWCADDRHTVVFGLVPADLGDVPIQPRRDQLPSEIRDVLKERVASGGPLWVAGAADDWKKTRLPLLFAKVKPADRDSLNGIRTFAAWAQFEQGVTIWGTFHCRDDKDTEAVESYFKRLGKADNPDLKTAVEGGWLTVQWRTQVETVLKALEK
jgi:hypothetical protein